MGRINEHNEEAGKTGTRPCLVSTLITVTFSFTISGPEKSDTVTVLYVTATNNTSLVYQGTTQPNQKEILGLGI